MHKLVINDCILNKYMYCIDIDHQKRFESLFSKTS